MREFFKLMRPSHWIKNILIFIPAFFAGNLWELGNINNLILGFICFSFVASIVYIFNDLKDVEKDRKHEIKRNRPIASGAVSIKAAWYQILLLGIGAACINSMITCIHPYLHMLWCMVYFVLNIAYSNGLKNLPIVDVAFLSAGFIIRVFYGAAVSGVEASSWLCLTVMSFALYMGIGKRRNELAKTGENFTRKVLQYYDIALLDNYMMTAATLGITFYSLWAGTGGGTDSLWMVWTVPLVLFIIMKYEMVVRKDSYGDPVEVLLSDKGLCCLVVSYAVLMFVFIYVLE